jgi:hypothetical protein
MSERDASGHWKKGTSGNPGGRPKLVAEVRDLAQDETAASIKTLASIRDNARAPAQARVAACSALLDRGWGKPAQSVDQTIKGDGMVVKVIKFADAVGYIEDAQTKTAEPVKH